MPELPSAAPEVDADLADSPQLLVLFGRQGVKKPRLIGGGGAHLEFDGVVRDIQPVLPTERLQIHGFTVEEIVPLSDPPGLGGGPLQRLGGEDGAAVVIAGAVHQRGVGGGVAVRAPHIVAEPPVRHRFPGDQPVGGEHGLAEQLGVLELVFENID